MNKDPEEIRVDIERTRGELRGDVDAIVDKVSPSNIAHRQNEKIKGAVRRTRDAVMGSADTAGSETHHVVGEAEDALRDAPGRVASQTRGNPLAAGLIAFGAGLLAASLFPGSDTEQDLVKSLKDKAEPVTKELADATKQVVEDLKEPVLEATETIKTSAQESAYTLKDETADQIGQLKNQDGDAAGGLRQDPHTSDTGPWTPGGRG